VDGGGNIDGLRNVCSLPNKTGAKIFQNSRNHLKIPRTTLKFQKPPQNSRSHLKISEVTSKFQKQHQKSQKPPQNSSIHLKISEANSKFQKPPQNSRCQKGGIKYVL
jgi:hypothetical protein